MATAALGGTYTLSVEGAKQLADLAESGSPVSSPDFSSRLRTDSVDTRDRLSALQSMLRDRAARTA